MQHHSVLPSLLSVDVAILLINKLHTRTLVCRQLRVGPDFIADAGEEIARVQSGDAADSEQVVCVRRSTWWQESVAVWTEATAWFLAVRQWERRTAHTGGQSTNVVTNDNEKTKVIWKNLHVASTFTRWRHVFKPVTKSLACKQSLEGQLRRHVVSAWNSPIRGVSEPYLTQSGIGRGEALYHGDSIHPAILQPYNPSIHPCD